MCFGKTPKIEMPQQPLMPRLLLCLRSKSPSAKQLFTPSPIRAQAEDFGTGTMKSGLKGKQRRRKLMSTTKLTED